MTRPWPAPGWRVRIEAHDLGRWSIPEQIVEVRAVNDVQARIAAAREAHRAGGLPPWRPLLRSTYLRARVLGQVDDGRAHVEERAA